MLAIFSYWLGYINGIQPVKSPAPAFEEFAFLAYLE